MILRHNLNTFLDNQKLKIFYKKSRLEKPAIKCGVRLDKKLLYVASDYIEQKSAKK